MTMVDLDSFAADWVDAFNARDLERVLSHYADDVRLYSPRVKQILGDPSGCVRGKAALRDYFAKGMSGSLRFELERIFPGEGSAVLRIRTNEGREGAELVVFGPGGLVNEVRAHWTAG